jgi:ATP-dependent Clp protease ATP-binding subunit ClpC
VSERFDERVRQVAVLAQYEARALRHDYIGTEHLLLGLLGDEEGVAARVLDSLGATIESVRELVKRVVGRGDALTAGPIPFTTRGREVLKLAVREARSAGETSVGTEHILLGLVRDEEDVAARILREFGGDAERIRREVEDARATAAGGRSPGAGRDLEWAYHVESLPDAQALTEEWLNALGRRGWELAAVMPAGNRVRAIFKRFDWGRPAS